MSDIISDSRDILNSFFGALANNSDYKSIINKINNQLREYDGLLRDKSTYLKAQLEKLAVDYIHKYKSKVSPLRTEIQKTKKPRELNSFVAEGSTTFAYAINDGVVGILYGLENNGKILPLEEIFGMLRKVLAGILAVGIKGTPRILGYSLQDGAIIFELVPGCSQIGNDIGKAEKYTDKELSELIRIITDIHSKGLCIDYYPDNLIYNKVFGFSIIDICLQKREIVATYRDIMALRFMLIGKNRSAAEHTKRRLESFRLGLRVLKIVKNNFPDLVSDFRQAGKSILTIGDANLYVEFDANNWSDREFLVKAEKIISS